MRVRLQKYLADCGVCSRRKGEELIAAGMIRVNGAIVTTPGTTIEAGKDLVAVGKRPVAPRHAKQYILLNKPAGVVTSCAQDGARTVLDLIRIPCRVFPVGRLDKESTGLILLTNDGDLAYRLMHPRFEHEKEYVVEHSGSIEPADIMRLVRGIRLGKGVTQRAEVSKLTGRKFRITLREGKYHQIRRMIERLGSRVIKLKRIRIGPLVLGKMAPGEWRHLSPTERRALLATTDGEASAGAAPAHHGHRHPVPNHHPQTGHA